LLLGKHELPGEDMLKIVFSALAVFSLSASTFAAQEACENISKLAKRSQVLLDPPASHKVIGKGRLYFHTAPIDNCRSNEIFVIPGDELIAYTEFKEWYSVMYINPKTGKDYEGWVKAERLGFTGTVRPKY